MLSRDQQLAQFERKVRQMSPFRRYLAVLFVSPFIVLPLWPIAYLLGAATVGFVLAAIKWNVPQIELTWVQIVWIVLGVGGLAFVVGILEAFSQMWRDRNGLTVDQHAKRDRWQRRRAGRWARVIGLPGFLLLLGGMFGGAAGGGLMGAGIAYVMGVTASAVQAPPQMFGTVFFAIGMVPGMLVGVIAGGTLFVRYGLWVISRRKGRRRAVRFCLRVHRYDSRSFWSRLEYKLYGIDPDELEPRQADAGGHRRC